MLSVVTDPEHGPLLNVHLNVFVPTERPLTVEVGELALENEPEPAITLHVPVAGAVGVLPASVAELLGKQTV